MERELDQNSCYCSDEIPTGIGNGLRATSVSVETVKNEVLGIHVHLYIIITSIDDLDAVPMQVPSHSA